MEKIDFDLWGHLEKQEKLVEFCKKIIFDLRNYLDFGKNSVFLKCYSSVTDDDEDYSLMIEYADFNTYKIGDDETLDHIGSWSWLEIPFETIQNGNLEDFEKQFKFMKMDVYENNRKNNLLNE